MKLHDSTKKLICETKNGENVPVIEVAEVILVQFNLVDDQLQQSLRYYIFLRLIILMVNC